jgi:NAD(P)-dependent dehydrogenase (short-subunit alcohol dehydrogenase family)
MKTWFITGTSRGFGREWTIAALERGDQVAATARDVSSLDDLVTKYGDALLPIALDVDDRAADFAAVKLAYETFGRLDVVVNNAGYGQFGMFEELTEAELRAQLDTNLFGAMWVTQASLPYLREQGSGHIIQVSSIGGVNAFAGLSAYHASKWALEGFSQALSQEVAAFGIHVTLVEPGGYSTDWGGASAKRADPLASYDEVREMVARWRAERTASPGDPVATRDAILAVVDAEQPPLRVFFGNAGLDMTTAEYEKRLATWREWQPVSVAAHG